MNENHDARILNGIWNSTYGIIYFSSTRHNNENILPYNDYNANNLYLFFFIISKDKEADIGCGENPAWRNTDRHPRDSSYLSTGKALNLYLTVNSIIMRKHNRKKWWNDVRTVLRFAALSLNVKQHLEFSCTSVFM